MKLQTKQRHRCEAFCIHPGYGPCSRMAKYTVIVAERGPGWSEEREMFVCYTHRKVYMNTPSVWPESRQTTTRPMAMEMP